MLKHTRERMNRNYSQRIVDARDKIGRRLESYLSQRGLSAYALAEETYEKLGFPSVNSAVGLICSIRRGCPPSCNTDLSKGFSFTRSQLAHIAGLLKHIGVCDSDSLIRIIEKADSRFVYFNPSQKQEDSLDSSGL